MMSCFKIVFFGFLLCVAACSQKNVNMGQGHGDGNLENNENKISQKEKVSDLYLKEKALFEKLFRETSIEEKPESTDTKNANDSALEAAEKLIEDSVYQSGLKEEAPFEKQEYEKEIPATELPQGGAKEELFPDFKSSVSSEQSEKQAVSVDGAVVKSSDEKELSEVVTEETDDAVKQQAAEITPGGSVEPLPGDEESGGEEKLEETPDAYQSIPVYTPSTFIHSVNIGTFPRKLDAETEARKFIEKGYPVYLMEFKLLNKNTVYDVNIGQFESEDEAIKTGKLIARKESIDTLIMELKGNYRLQLMRIKAPGL